MKFGLEIGLKPWFEIGLKLWLVFGVKFWFARELNVWLVIGLNVWFGVGLKFWDEIGGGVLRPGNTPFVDPGENGIGTGKLAWLHWSRNPENTQ